METLHFLVPLDFSEYAEHTLAYVIPFAKQFQASVTLLHVIDLPTTVHQGIEPYHTELHTTSKQMLDRYAQRLQGAGIAGATAVAYGVPFQEIIDFAKAKKVHLIFMGTHGRTGLQHMLLGSVTERVVRLAPCPVLVTRLTSPEGGSATIDPAWTHTSAV